MKAEGLRQKYRWYENGSFWGPRMQSIENYQHWPIIGKQRKIIYTNRCKDMRFGDRSDDQNGDGVANLVSEKRGRS